MPDPGTVASRPANPRHLRPVPPPEAAGPAPARPRAEAAALALGYAVLFGGILAYAFGRMPIFAGDTDLWYHLTGGRYLWETGRIANESFFSFVDPPRTRVDYYWLFQAAVYGVYRWAGYPGLVALRLALALGFFSVAAALVLGRGRDGRRLPAVGAFLLVFLVVVVAGGRYTLLRPHTVSYLLALVFVYVLERRPAGALLLPPLAALWANVHGVTYPVLYLICLAYLGELGWRRLRTGRHLERGQYLRAGCLLLSLLAVYATPHGAELLPVPFTSTEYASQYIQELVPARWDGFLSFHVGRLVPSPRTAFNLLAAFAAAGIVAGALSRRLRVSHLLLVAGGAALLVKGGRLTTEFSILALPLLVEALRSAPALASALGRAPVRWAGGAALAAAAVAYGHALNGNPGRFPFSPANLPVGVTAFLQKADAGGRVLNHHNTGGYVQWELYPRYRIFMDMEVPFLFTDEDMFRSSNAFADPEVLAEVTGRYRPGFLSVPLQFEGFPRVVAGLPRYRPVFFDHAEVLYADAEQHPELVERFGLEAVDPFRLVGRTAAELREQWGEAADAAVAELERVAAEVPSNPLPHQVLAIVRLAREEYEGAAEHADVVIDAFPESASGWKLKADALRGLKRHEEALGLYDRALERAQGDERRAVHRMRGLVFAELDRHEEAYDALRKGVAVYGPDTTYKDLFYLGSAAFLVGRLAEARTLIRFAYEKVPADDAEWVERLEKYLEILKIEPWKRSP